MKQLHMLFAGISLACLCSVNTSFAQVGYYEDVYRYGMTNPVGSSRFLAIGGANTSLGGDISSAYTNPAGLGFYNRSEITFSPGFHFANSESVYTGQRTPDFKANFNVGNLGLVINHELADGDWKRGTFAVSMMRTNNFHNNISYQGQDTLFDFVGSVLSESNFFYGNRDAVSDLTYLGQEVQLVLDNFDSAYYETDIDPPTGDFPVLQNENVRYTGGQTQWNVSYGANYKDRIYIGAGLGVTSLNWHALRTFTENYSETVLNQLVIREDADKTGVGINATMGLIARPMDFIMVGASFTTPTYWNMRESRTLGMDALYSDGFEDVAQLESNTRYTLRTPMRYSVGASALVGKYGFVSLDWEQLNYGSARLRSDDFLLTEDNEIIDEAYSTVTNVRLGAEARLGDFRLRLGFNSMGDPLSGLGDGIDRSRQFVTFGAGVKKKNIYFDVAVVNRLNAEQSFFEPYTRLVVIEDGGTETLTPVVDADYIASASTNRSQLQFTLGFTF